MSQHLTPCNECPFRRKSLRGYVGAHKDSTEIVDLPMSDAKFPCHKEVNAIQEFILSQHDDDDPLDSITDKHAFEQAVREAPHCAGSIAFINNLCKKSQDPRVREIQDKIGRRDDVFARPQEMVDYHNPGLKYEHPLVRAMKEQRHDREADGQSGLPSRPVDVPVDDVGEGCVDRGRRKRKGARGVAQKRRGGSRANPAGKGGRGGGGRRGK